MPVVVLGASGAVGRRAVPAFTAASPDVRAVVPRPEAAAGLREAGARVAVGALDDVDNLAAVMAGAHTVCHLAAGPGRPGPEGRPGHEGRPGLEGRSSLEGRSGLEGHELTVVEAVRAALAAASMAGVRRFLYLSAPGASPEAADPSLRAMGAAEALVAGSGLEHVVVRSALVYGPGDRWLAVAASLARGRIPAVVGSGRQPLAPVFVDDVAAVLAAADDRERIRSGTWGLQGPDRVDGDGLAELLAGRRRRWVHVPPRAALLLRPGADRPDPETLETLAAGSLVDADGLPDAAVEFGVRLTPLREGLARSGAA